MSKNVRETKETAMRGPGGEHDKYGVPGKFEKHQGGQRLADGENRIQNGNKRSRWVTKRYLGASSTRAS